MFNWKVVAAVIAAHKRDEQVSRAGGNPYRSALWTFTRHIKSHCTEGETPEEVFDEVDALVRGHGGWSEIAPELDAEEIFLEFTSNWRDSRYRTDENALDRANRAAQLRPLSHKRFSGNERLEGYGESISLAGWLQKQVGNGPIMLPVEPVGRVLDKAPKTVTRYRQRAQDDGFLIVAVRHFPGKLATKFRFAVEEFPELAN